MASFRWGAALWALLLAKTVGLEFAVMLALVGYPVLHYVRRRWR